MPNDNPKHSKKTGPKLRRPWFDVSFIILTVFGVFIVAFLFFFYPKCILPSLIAGFVLYLGFGIPRWWGSGKRKERALTAKQEEEKKWGFYSRDREGPWINYIDYPLVKKTEYASGKLFYSEWLVIREGYIMVNPGKPEVDLNEKTVKYDFTDQRTYAWDGCTPKRWFFWLALIGTPDWGQKIEKIKTIKRKSNDDYVLIGKDVFWQKAHHASLVHDVLYQYLDNIPISKKNVDKLFRGMLKDSGVFFGIRWLYHFGVRYFGAWDIGEDDPKRNSDFKVIAFPEFD